MSMYDQPNHQLRTLSASKPCLRHLVRFHHPAQVKFIWFDLDSYARHERVVELGVAALRWESALADELCGSW